MVKKIKNIVSTHIEGFDKLLGGGFPNGSCILINGSAGTGKTIFSLQFLYNCVIFDDVKCIYFSFEEKSRSLIGQAKQFNWEIEKSMKEEKIKIISMGIDDIDKNTVSDMVEIIRNFDAKRIVIDSITTLAHIMSPIRNDLNINEYSIKNFLYSFISTLKDEEYLTSIIISQKDDKTSSDLAQYLSDGIIDINYESLSGDHSRNLIIRKMRRVDNDEDLHPMEIRDGKGVIVHDL